MLTIMLKGILSHRVRLVLTTLSVVLGVAFVVGTFVLTDTMTQVFDDLVRGGPQTADVIVRPASGDERAITDSSAYGAATLPADLVEELGAVDGVAQATGSVEGYALISTPDGEPIMPMGPPTLGLSWTPSGDRIIRDGGRAPAAHDEVVVDAATADKHALELGDELSIAFAATPPRSFTLVGASTVEGGDTLAGATLAAFDLATAQEVLELPDVVTTITLQGAPGVDPDVLAERLELALPADAEAITAADWADESMAQIEDSLGFVTTALTGFAGLALLVGAFIIANTFSITVLQRTGEFALLRALGASRRQVVTIVLAEALAVGLVASLLGVVAGLGIAVGLQELIRVFGVDMPSGTLVLQPGTVLVGLAVGIGVTVLSALLPARRAAGVHPMAALRTASAPARPLPTARLVVGSSAAVVAAALISIAAVARPGHGALMVGLGAVLALVALAVTGPALTRPCLRLLGGDGRHFGIVGRLARRSSLRTPRRTWTTAAALTIGLVLVSSVAVMGASMKASVSEAMATSLRADVILTSRSTFTGGAFPAVLAVELAARPEVGAVSPFRVGEGELDGRPATLISIDPVTWDAVTLTEFVDGSLASLVPEATVAVDADLAAVHGYAVGDPVAGRFPAAGMVDLRIAAIFEADDFASGWLTATTTSTPFFTQQLDAAVLAAAADGVDDDQMLAATEEVASAYPAVAVQNRAEYGETVAGEVDQVLALVTALLGMSLVIAVLGIMNTLALSIHERTREIGLLRAVGMTRPQVRRMVRWESVTVALLGTSIGLLLGTTLGWAATRVLADQGMAAFVVPTGQLAGAIVLTGIAGVLAAVLPARTAARLDVLRAMTVQ